MKHVLRCSLVTFISVLICSCSPVVHVEKDPTVNLGSYKTYAWVDTKSSKDENGTSASEFAKLSIQNAVNEQLQHLGWKQVNDHPDVLVTYDILVERKVEERNNPVFMQPFTRFYYNPFFHRWAAIYYPSRFIGYNTYTVPVREATVSISIMDAKTDKKVWQGWTTEAVDSRFLAKDEVRSSVNRIFKRFDASVLKGAEIASKQV
ncbi:DUF4136 domain-containing protein [Longitalea luteola]|uniref:DUF4136 domain-containing protein n=1 Tax=Longitalea luteola TaxID=2812563 RepID=UPI001A9623C6|nr:DUF4136 domain-containing protein [Longitalea luteola]